LAGLDIEAVEHALAARAADAALAAAPKRCHCDPDAPQHPDSPAEQVERDCCPGALAQVCVDGKCLRGTADTGGDQEKLVSACEPNRGVSLAQTRVPESTNETACFQPLLNPLDLTDTLVSADAAHTNRANARWLVADKPSSSSESHHNRPNRTYRHGPLETSQPVSRPPLSEPMM
jgi:hypothetical protein